MPALVFAHRLEIPASQDAYVTNALPSSNFGEAVELRVAAS
jgi:hypothetical protein